MSKFFRSGDSTTSSGTDSGSSSSSEDDDDDTQNISDSTELSRLNANASSSAGVSHHRDLLLHALLEERCLNEAREHLPKQRADSPEVRTDGRRRYQRMCGQLASYNLISSGLDGDHYAHTRQRYRDGLDILSQQSNSNTVAPTLRRLLTDGDASGALWSASPNFTGLDITLGRPSVPYPLRRLITGPEQVEHIDTPARTLLGPTFDIPSQDLAPRMMPESRYRHEFEELDILGRAPGVHRSPPVSLLTRQRYGIVYSVRHRLDNQVYAVKKVRLSTSRLQRIQRNGQTGLEEVLRELRTLAKLDHPNIVRYYSSWIEWIDATSRSEHVASGSNISDAIPGAADEDVSVGRVRTESSSDQGEVLFENSNSLAATSNNDSSDIQLQRVETRSTIATVTDETIESIDRSIEPSHSLQPATSGINFAVPTLALHIQMSLYPMTLADFLAPPPGTHDATPPLSHCFHLAPSVSILLAVLDGLEYLHGEGVIHRDIKPANIFLGSHSDTQVINSATDRLPCGDCRAQHVVTPAQLEVRIGDFGLVSVADSEIGKDASDTDGGIPENNEGIPPSEPPEDIANAGPAPNVETVLGKPGARYPQGPEVVGTTVYRPSTPQATGPGLDIYALGIVAFELQQKFDTKMERLDTIQKLKSGHFPNGFCFSLNAERAQKVKKCIMYMLDSSSSGRSVRDVREMVAALRSEH